MKIIVDKQSETASKGEGSWNKYLLHANLDSCANIRLRNIGIAEKIFANVCFRQIKPQFKNKYKIRKAPKANMLQHIEKELGKVSNFISREKRSIVLFRN